MWQLQNIFLVRIVKTVNLVRIMLIRRRCKEPAEIVRIVANVTLSNMAKEKSKLQKDNFCGGNCMLMGLLGFLLLLFLFILKKKGGS